MNVALGCIALLGLLLVALGLAVSLTRGRTETVIGHSSDPTDKLHKLVRAHGNTTEYAPMLALLIYVLGTRDPGSWSVGWMIGATASRYLLAAGMLLSPTLAAPHPLRFVGALGTYVCGAALVIALLLSL